MPTRLSAALLLSVSACSSVPEPGSIEERLAAYSVAWVEDGHVRVSRGDGSRRRIIAEPPTSDEDGNARLKWSDATITADGRMLAVVRRDGQPDPPRGFCTRSELVLFPLDDSSGATEPQVIWNVDACIETLSWSRDGRRLLFMVRFDAPSRLTRWLDARWPARHAYVLDRDADGSVRQIELRPDFGVAFDAFDQVARFTRAEWAPDDHRIALRWESTKHWYGIATIDGALRVLGKSELVPSPGGSLVAQTIALAEDPEADAILSSTFWPAWSQMKPGAATLLARSADGVFAWFATERPARGIDTLDMRTRIVIAEETSTEVCVEIETGETYWDFWN